MKERYVKQGSSVRLERSGRVESIILISECGIAESDGTHFRCHPMSTPGDIPPRDTDAILALAARAGSLVAGRGRLERLAISVGSTVHFVEDALGKRTWIESNARLHASVIDPTRRLRAAVDLGATTAEGIDLRPLEEIAAALALPPAAVPFRGERMALSPQVAASLWATLTLHRLAIGGGSLVVRQSTHPDLVFDGRGARIRRRLVLRHGAHSAAAWPNVFRPSYRFAPVRLPFHLRADCMERDGPRPRPRAVALLSGFEVGRRFVEARVLVSDGRSASAARLLVPRDTIGERVASVGRSQSWFPIAAGVWGGRTVLTGIELG